MSKFKTGDKVAFYMTGEVRTTKGRSFDAPVEVKHSDGNLYSYTEQGKRYKTNDVRGLFTEQELELQFIAKFALRLLPSGTYIAQSNDGWFLVYEQEPRLKDDTGYWQSDFSSVYVCRTEPSADPIKQLFKISDILNHE